MNWRPQLFVSDAARPSWRGYVVAAGVTTLALALRMCLTPLLGILQPFAFFYLSVALSAWLVGVGPGVFSAGAGLLLGWFFFLQPSDSFVVENVAPMAVYVVLCTFFIGFARVARRAERVALHQAEKVRSAEAALKQQNALLVGLAESVLDGILIVSREKRVLYANEEFRRIWKLPAEVMASGSDDSAIEWATRQVADPAAFHQALRLAYSRPERATRAEFQMRDGRVFDRFGAPVVNKGVYYGWVWTFRDVTENRRAEERLRESERHLRRVIDNLSTFVVILELDGTVIEVNRAPLELAGLRDSDVLGRKFWECHWWHYSPEVRWQLEAAVTRAARGEAIRYDVPIQTAGEKLTWIDFQIAPLRDSHGQITHLVPSAMDITARRETEQALRTSEELFRAVADNIPQLAWMTSAEGEMLWFNRRWLDYTGKDLEQMRGIGWAAVHDPNHPRSIAEGWLRALRTGEPWDDTFPLRGRDGQFRWFLSRAFPIRDPEGKITRWFGTNTDITRLRETEDALKLAHEELRRHALDLEEMVAERTARLRQTIQELEAFSYSLSHDMRAPLRAMKGFAQILDSEFGEQLGVNGKVYLGKIATAAGRLDQLIQDVLTYSRIAGEKIELVPIDMERLLQQLIDENPALQPPRAQIELKMPLHPVLGHEAYLMQVLSNLVYNAVKFVVSGQQPRVSIWTEPCGDRHVRLLIRDNGIGIPPDAQERIFRMFERFHSGKTYEGTGIGLAIVRKAVDRMSGEVGVDSAAGQGSTFWVKLKKPEST